MIDKRVGCRLLGAAGIFLSTTVASISPTPGIELLDQAYGFGGLSFGTLDTQAPGLTHEASGIGKRWRNTKLYRRPLDTTTVGMQRVQPTYWFRNHRLVGVTVEIASAQGAQVLAFLKRKYGPSQQDTATPSTEYWLGKRTYILFEPVYPKSRGWELHIGSLGMLNEQVVETAVRQEARTKLGWQPDSLGLPPQFKQR